MLILAIESSCDDTACAIIKNGREILSTVVSSQIDIHKIYGGVVPEIASRTHIESISPLVEKALKKAEVDLTEIDAVAVTAGPGLIGSLLVGVNFAKGLALSLKKPLVPVHHLRSHIAANYLSHKNLKPPFLSLVISGGHSSIIEVKDYTTFKTIGQTVDDAPGETLDKVARVLGVPYPGGANLDKNYSTGNKNAYEFPFPHVDDSPYDFSFSGIKTNAINQIHNLNQKGEKPDISDFGSSLMNSVAHILSVTLEKAAKDFSYDKIVLAGGVSANSFVRDEISKMCKKNNYELYLPELFLCGDNAAMVGSAAYYEYKSGNIGNYNLNAVASMGIDESF